MRLLLSIAVLTGAACAPPPRASGPGFAGELTVQQCSAVAADAVAPGTGTAPPAGAVPVPPPAPEPQVRIGELSVPAGSDGGAIKQVISEALPRLRRCYRQTLDNVAGLEGKMTIAFHIDAAGKATTADSGGGFHAGVAACVEDVVRSLRFAASAKGLDVSLPLTFRLPDDSAPVAAAPAAPATPAAAGEAPAAAEAPAVAPTFPGDADAFASTVVAQAIQERADAIIGCSQRSGDPVQLGFDVTVTIRSAAIGEARVDGLLDPAVELCIGGVLRGVALSAAPATATGARCSLLLRPR